MFLICLAILLFLVKVGKEKKYRKSVAFLMASTLNTKNVSVISKLNKKVRNIFSSIPEKKSCEIKRVELAYLKGKKKCLRRDLWFFLFPAFQRNFYKLQEISRCSVLSVAVKINLIIGVNGLAETLKNLTDDLLSSD